MSELPQGWIRTSLGEIGKWSSGGTPSRRNSEHFGKGIPWVKSGDLPDGPITKTEEQITDLGLNNSSAKVLPPGTISLALYGATIGKLGVMTFPAATNQACANVEPDSRLIDPQYLFFYLMSERKALIDKGQGGAQPNISQQIVRAHDILLAPLTEQRRIVAKLEKLLSRVGAARARLATIPFILKRFRQSVLAAACSGRLTTTWRQTQGVPEDYERTTVEDVADYVGGFAYRSPTFTESGSNQVVRIGNVRPFSLKLDVSPVFIPDEVAKATERFKLASGDIVVSMTGTKYKKDYGYAAIVTGTINKLFLNQRVSRLRCNERILSLFLLYWLQTDTFRDFFFKGETGNVNQGNVGADGIRNAPVELPSLREQQEIIRRVEALFKTADALEARYNKAKAHVDKLTQSILARAFRGELVPQDPNDEPVSILLERIRTELARKEKVPKKTRRTGSLKPKRSEVTMLRPEETKHSHLSDILKDRGPLSPEALWKESQLDIDDFYDQLKLEETRGLLKETSNDASKASRLLEAA